MPNFSLNDQVFFDAAQAFETPFHLYTEEGIRQTARGLIRAFSGVPFSVSILPSRRCPTPAFCASSRRKAAAWTAPARPN